jgi:hypothetical protein
MFNVLHTMKAYKQIESQSATTTASGRIPVHSRLTDESTTENPFDDIFAVDPSDGARTKKTKTHWRKDKKPSDKTKQSNDKKLDETKQVSKNGDVGSAKSVFWKFWW